MRRANVYYKRQLAGELTEHNKTLYSFTYESSYFLDKSMPSISLTLPKNRQEYHATHLFPFFYSMLAEGVNKKLQSRQLHIDEDDSFGLLLATAGNDTIGAITVKPIKDEPTRDQ